MCVKEILSIWIIQPSEKRLSKDTADFLLKNMHYGRHLFISELDTARLKSGICSLGWMTRAINFQAGVRGNIDNSGNTRVADEVK